MVTAPFPANEKHRLQELYTYNILDSDEEADFNHLVEIASLICQCHISAINFIDTNRQWTKAHVGMNSLEAPRKISMCAHAILENDVLLVEDTLSDDRFFDNPFTTEGGVRFYAGAPIQTGNGFKLGTLCVADTQPKILSPGQIEALQKLARQAAILLELRRKNTELHQLALSEQALKEEARLAQRSQEEFLSAMSHEIRTPLNGIIGMVKLMEEGTRDAELLEYMSTLRFSSNNLLHIVNDILDYNKVSAGKMELEETEFDIYQLVHDIRKLHSVKAREKELSVEATIDPRIPKLVKADPTRLTQVLNNLAGNAVKFTPYGSVRIRLQWVAENETQLTVLVQVVDTGIGIAENKKDLIFEQFAQASESTTRQFGGTGLGLAITRKLVELMGSKITVLSQVNAGSCFSFQVQLKKVAQAPVTAVATPASSNQSFSGLKAMIVEDNEVNILILRRFLEKMGIRPLIKRNGQEVLEAEDLASCELILMDMYMPVMDGATTVRKLRQEKHFTRPVILLSADAFADSEEFAAMGFDGFILKPYKLEELQACIERVMAKQQASL